MAELSWKGRGLSIGAGLLRATTNWLLPRDCFLCGQPSAENLLCGACRDSLPRLPLARCAACALPTPHGETCGECLTRTPHFDATFAALIYEFPVDRLIQALKYSHRLAVADFLALQMTEQAAPKADLLLPVPLSALRLRERGFNQAIEIAKPLARHLGLPLMIDACMRTADTVPQTSLPWKERRKNIRNAFECRIDLSGRHVVVVDDVMTTGATLDEFAKTLKQHGAVSVTNWVVARTLKG